MRSEPACINPGHTLHRSHISEDIQVPRLSEQYRFTLLQITSGTCYEYQPHNPHILVRK